MAPGAIARRTPPGAPSVVEQRTRVLPVVMPQHVVRPPWTVEDVQSATIDQRIWSNEPVLGCPLSASFPSGRRIGPLTGSSRVCPRSVFSSPS